MEKYPIKKVNTSLIAIFQKESKLLLHIDYVIKKEKRRKNLSEEEIKNLCKENDIDEDLVYEFIKKTNARPFLMGKPSSYFLEFAKKQKGISFIAIEREKFIFDQTEFQILNIISERFKNSEIKCKFCANSVLDYLTLKKNEKETTMCFFCFSKKLLSFFLEIKENVIEDFINMMISENLHSTVIKLILILIRIYYENEYEINKNQFNNLKENIGKSKIDLSSMPVDQDYIQEYYKRIVYINIIRAANIERFTGNFDHLKFFKKIRNKEEKKLNIMFRGFAEIIRRTKEFFGTMIQAWKVEDAIGLNEPAYVIEVAKQTEKAILCNFSLLNGSKRIHHTWIPKSTINMDSTKWSMFNRIIQQKILINMGLII